jgi:hypothetical protein
MGCGWELPCAGEVWAEQMRGKRAAMAEAASGLQDLTGTVRILLRRTGC